MPLSGSGELRFLFFKSELAWPFRSGPDVHTFHMMKALIDAGHSVGLLTAYTPASEVLAHLSLAFRESLDTAKRPGADHRFELSGPEERFRSYWGVRHEHIRRLGDLAEDFRADVVVVAGLEVLPMLAGIESSLRVWYAADEGVLHHLSQVQFSAPRSWGNVRDAALRGGYEWAYRRRLDRVWVVSKVERMAFRAVAHVPRVDILPNGVDAEYYHPSSLLEQPMTAVFWGRLDFGPNIQALEWFCRRVWPSLTRARPDARFTIIGFQITPPVAALAAITGVRVTPDVPDIRPEVAGHAVVVLPFVSGTGIKNKLLEAAAMGKAVVCSPKALSGAQGKPPFRPTTRPSEWVSRVLELWDHSEERRRLGQQAREWVVRDHSWAATARVALVGVEESLARRKPPVGDLS